MAVSPSGPGSKTSHEVSCTCLVGGSEDEEVEVSEVAEK